MNTIAERIEQVRRQLGLSQRELARIMKVGQPSVSKYIQGRSVPSPLALYHLARAVNRPMEWFIEGDYPPRVAEEPVVYGTGGRPTLMDVFNGLPSDVRNAFETLIRAWPHDDINILRSR